MRKIAFGIAAAIVVASVVKSEARSQGQQSVAFDNDGRVFASVAKTQATGQRKRAGRIHRAARHHHHGRGVSMAGIGHSTDQRPRAWCGWWMRQQLGMRDRALNLARNWQHVGRAATPAPGVVVVWRHHVGRIIAVTGNGKAIVESGNDGGAVRRRERSISNAIAFREV